MSASAKRRRAAAKADPYRNALPGVLRMPAGCMTRCEECRSRCMNGCSAEEPRCVETGHWFACDH